MVVFNNKGSHYLLFLENTTQYQLLFLTQLITNPIGNTITKSNRINIVQKKLQYFSSAFKSELQN